MAAEPEPAAPVTTGPEFPADKLGFLALVKKQGLQAAFHPNDSRSDTVRGLWPGDSMVTDQVLDSKLKELSRYLVADTYGNVDVVRWAREAYNSRPDS